MTEQPLPKPVSVEACYLAAILAELRALRGNLERPAALTPVPSPKRGEGCGVVELREAGEAPARRRGRPPKAR